MAAKHMLVATAALALLLAGIYVAVPRNVPPDIVSGRAKGNLIWSDEFDEFDATSWSVANSIAGGGNAEFQEYIGSAVSVADGYLALTPGISSLPESQIWNGTRASGVSRVLERRDGQASRGDAAAATWTFRVDVSRRRRGRAPGNS